MALKKILVVNNAPAERQLLQKVLSQNGYQPILADNGEEAVEKSQALLPELILMDVFISGLNGFQATRLITTHETTRRIPIIILTVPGRETDRIWGLAQGARDYLTKPIDAAELLKKIRALDRAQATPIATTESSGKEFTAPTSADTHSSHPLPQPTRQANAIPQESLAAAEKQLAQYIGPLAKILVKKAAEQTDDIAEFHRLLADNINDDNQRKIFLIEVSKNS